MTKEPNQVDADRRRRAAEEIARSHARIDHLTLMVDDFDGQIAEVEPASKQDTGAAFTHSVKLAQLERQRQDTVAALQSELAGLADHEAFIASQDAPAVSAPRGKEAA